LTAVIHERTAGVPLFVEHLIGSWVGDGSLSVLDRGLASTVAVDVLAASVPEGVRQLIEHMYERLSPEEQAMLAAASVAGRDHLSAEVAAACGRPDDEVEAMLAELGRRGVFVRPRGEETWPDGTTTARFAFEHDLHREVLYRRLGPARAAAHHRAIGARLELAHDGQPGGEAAPLLASHFVAGGDAPRALRYCMLAAEHQLRRSAHREALVHLENAAAMVRRLPESTARAQEELRVQIALGNALITAKGYAAPETVDAYAVARQMCERLGDGPHFLPVLYGLWNHAVVGGRHQSALELAEAFLELAERTDDNAVVVAHRAVGWPLVFLGRVGEALVHLGQIPESLDESLTSTLVASYGEDPAATGLSAMSFALWLAGDDQRAREASQDALRRAVQVGHPLTRVYALTFAAIVAQMCEDVEVARRLAGEAVDLSRRHSIPVFEAVATTPLAWALGAAGDEGAVDLLRGGLAAASATGSGVLQPFSLATLGELLAARGDRVEALSVLDSALGVAAEGGEHFYDAEIHRRRGVVLLTAGDLVQARQCLEQAVDIAAAQGIRPFEVSARRQLEELHGVASEHTTPGSNLATPPSDSFSIS
jgi:tetratricopeptide (TPR) repeat protein